MFNMKMVAALILIASLSNAAVASDAVRTKAQEVVDGLYVLLLEDQAGSGGSDEEIKQRASLMYEACYKNPAGSKLAHPQKQLYCLIPLSFRLCLTPKLVLSYGPRSQAGPILFRECETAKGLDFESRLPAFSEMFNDIFFVDNRRDIIVGENYDFTGTPVVTDRSFAGVLAANASAMVRESERRFCREVTGETSPACGP